MPKFQVDDEGRIIQESIRPDTIPELKQWFLKRVWQVQKLRLDGAITENEMKLRIHGLLDTFEQAIENRKEAV